MHTATPPTPLAVFRSLCGSINELHALDFAPGTPAETARVTSITHAENSAIALVPFLATGPKFGPIHDDVAAALNLAAGALSIRLICAFPPLPPHKVQLSLTGAPYRAILSAQDPALLRAMHSRGLHMDTILYHTTSRLLKAGHTTPSPDLLDVLDTLIAERILDLQNLAPQIESVPHQPHQAQLIARWLRACVHHHPESTSAALAALARAHYPIAFAALFMAGARIQPDAFLPGHLQAMVGSMSAHAILSLQHTCGSLEHLLTSPTTCAKIQKALPFHTKTA